MNHTDIEEQQIAERYVMGNLSPEEAASFEEHYLSCQECLDRLELAESMERGFKRAAGQDVAQLATVQQVRQLAIVAWLARLGRSRQMAALVMAVFLVAVLPGLFALRQVRERDRELAATRTAREQERGRSTAGSQTAAAEAEKLRKDLEASRRDLAREQEAHAAADRERDAARQPQGNVPILYLDVERGAAKPSHAVHLPQPPGWIVLSPVVNPHTQKIYRIVLQDAGGRVVWRDDEELRFDEQGSFTLSLHSGLLQPGDYTLIVEGLPPGGKPVAAGRFVFRVLPAN